MNMKWIRCGAAHLPRPSRAALLITLFMMGPGILITLPSLGAFTAQTVNVTARLLDRPTIEKSVVRHPQIGQGQVDSLTGISGCQPADTTYPIEVPTETCVWWVLRITVRNSSPTAMSDVLVRDHLGAELGAAVLTYSRGQAQIITHVNQARLYWCVSGPLSGKACSAGGGQMFPADEETLDLLVFTKLNRSGKQAFTSPGPYELNSGATAHWLDPSGTPCGQEAGGCPSTPSIPLTAVCTDPCPEPTPTPTADRGHARPPKSKPTPTPTPEPTATPTPTPTPTATATPTPTPSPEPTSTPTAVPTPMETPTTTPTPSPTAESAPSTTRTPTPAATVTPTPEPTGTPQEDD